MGRPQNKGGIQQVRSGAGHSENFMPPWNELRTKEKKIKNFPKNALLGPHRNSSQNQCSASFYLRLGVCMPRGVKLDPW
jgi:hypothetical protein